MFCKVCDRKEGFCGFRIDIKELAKVSDIFLFTTLQEGMPRSMMEAMASGLPCIASKIRGNVDLLVEGKGGYLVPAKDAELVAECLRELINNKSLRKYMGNENLSRIKEFEVSIVKKKNQRNI
ncbi:glycosyltransferase [Enterococcus faecium]